MYKLKRWFNSWTDRDFRNNTNENWTIVETVLNFLKSFVTKVETDANKRIDNLIINAVGDSNAEVVDSRVDAEGIVHPTAKNRQDADYKYLKNEFGTRGVNVTWFGAVGDGETDSTTAFLTAEVNNPGVPIFCPPGVYKATGDDLRGWYYGLGAVVHVKEREKFNESIPPSQRTGVRIAVLSSIPQPILNEFNSRNSGVSVGLDAYANTASGEYALKELKSGKQNTAVGFQSQENNADQYSNVSFGSGSLSRGKFYSRSVALGNNAMKWAGIQDPIVSRHELWLNEKDQKNIWNIPGTDHYILKQMNPNVEKLIQPIGYPAPPGAEIVNPDGGFPAATSSSQVSGNTAMGRNALLQLVRGSQNTAMGYQALSRSYLTDRCTALGAFALANALAGKDNIAVGRNASKYLQDGYKNVILGNNAMGYSVHGNRNIAIGHQALQKSKGVNNFINTIIGTYAAQNKTDGEANVMIGTRAGLNSGAGARNVMVGTEAGANYTGSNSIIIGNKANPTTNQDRLLWIDYGNDANETPFIYGDMANNIMNVRANLRPDKDVSQALGTPSRRWKALYAETSTINTSDEREKQQISEIPDIWLDAWSEVNFCRYKFNSDVSVKGESAALWHVGVIAQRIDEVFKKYELDALKIGILTYDEWPAEYINAVDESGKITGEKIELTPAGNRYGIRADECQFLEMALMRREMKRLQEKQIKTIEVVQ
ncbi:tail fiber domain-containing protein [Bacillus cereus]|uniref:tail fiber domain-containing protein n=2 Tax=Bacteria TaxID=2 RepID=UPI0028533968|nr:tail fiber domain-containing protein [Bacillus cereus]MDR4986153.1 tail fiber domain-containing protein [Bacillus cereus]